MAYFRQYLSLLNLGSSTPKQQEQKKGAKDERDIKSKDVMSFGSRKQNG